MADPNSGDSETSSGAVAEESMKVTLKSSDGKLFEVEESVARESETIKNLIEDGCADNVIPLPNVRGDSLAKVIDYCKKHAGKSLSVDDKDLKQWDKDFVQIDWENLMDLILAANFLNIEGLLDVTTQAAADRIKDLSVETVRDLFGIENDYTPEEEEALRKEYQWAFE